MSGISTLTARSKMRVLQNIIQMEHWKSDDVNSLAQQRILFNGRLGRFIDFTRNVSVIEINEIDKISSYMYIALGCKCSDMISRSLKKFMHHYDNNNESNKYSFILINETVLKSISVLFNMIHIAPNLISYEPGFLTTALSLNLQLVELIKIIESKQNENFGNLFKQKIFQMVNSIDQYLVLNCYVKDMDPIIKNMGVQPPVINIIQNILDNSGLSTTYMREFIPDNKVSLINSFNVINHQLIEKLKPLLIISNELEAKIKNLNKIENISIYMHFISDSITKILYEIILQTLAIFELYSQEGNEDFMQILLNDWIDKEDIILQYQQLIGKSIFMKFPSNFINHIELVVKIIRDIIVQNSVLDFRTIKIQVHENLNALRNKKHPEKLLSMNNVSGHSFNEYLKILLSIDELKNFNEILALFQNDSVQYNSSEVTLNTVIDDSAPVDVCNAVLSFYNDLFNIQLKLNAYDSSMNINMFKKSCLLILNTFNEMFTKYKSILSRDMIFIFNMAIGFLENNMIHFPSNANQLMRIILFVSVLLDKFQIHNCTEPIHYHTLYNSYVKKKRTSEELTNNVNENNFENVQNTIEESLRLRIKNYITDFDNVTNVQSAKFYWKGELKTISEISNNLTTNVFEFSTFTKFYNIFHKWNFIVLFTALDDTLNNFLKESHSEVNNQQFMTYIQQIQKIGFPEYLLPPIRAIGNAESFNSSENTIRFSILMRENIQQHSMVLSKTDLSKEMNFFFYNLNIICKKMINIYNKKP